MLTIVHIHIMSCRDHIQAEECHWWLMTSRDVNVTIKLWQYKAVDLCVDGFHSSGFLHKFLVRFACARCFCGNIAHTASWEHAIGDAWGMHIQVPYRFGGRGRTVFALLMCCSKLLQQQNVLLPQRIHLSL
jgi:hypothetical protein